MARYTPEQAGFKSELAARRFIKAYNRANPEKPIGPKAYKAAGRKNTPEMRREVRAKNAGFASYEEARKVTARYGLKPTAFRQAQKERERRGKEPYPRPAGFQPWTKDSADFKKFKKAVGRWDKAANPQNVRQDFEAYQQTGLSEPEQYQLFANLNNFFAKAVGVDVGLIAGDIKDIADWFYSDFVPELEGYDEEDPYYDDPYAEQ